jgi:hypothetical protein
LSSRIEEVFATRDGLDAMKAVLRVALPLDEERRREWRTRLAVHAVAPDQREVREAFGDARRKWSSRPLARIASLQQDGWVHPDLDPDEVRRRLVGTVYAAVVALLQEPSPEEERRQLAIIDALLESLAAGDG